MAKRRANGEGSISKRKDGRWEGRFTVGYREDGKQIYKNVLAKTQAECAKKLKAAIAAAKEISASESAPTAYTLAEWIDIWYENFIKPNLRETTRNQYESFIRHHIKPYIGDISLTKLSSLDLQKLYNKLKTSGRIQTDHALPNPGLSAKTVRSIHMMLSSCLEKAVAERLIQTNPAHGCSIPPKEKREMKIIPPEQIGRFLTEAERAGYLAMFYLELTSGLRRGELLALLWTDVDIANCAISVSKQVIRVNGELKVLPPKTQNAVRKIVLPKQTIDLLIAEHERHPDHPLLFPSPKTGTYLDPPAVARKMKTLLARAGIDEIRFHDLRHTFATLSLQNGVDVKTLSHTLGHYSAGFTLDTYTHVTTQMQEDAAR
ncbi:MAG: site-specific integrase [Firmicutes bacterium]|nr:site-specific integrase [Bacillota bacterium]